PLSFLIPSSSGLATVAMPIMAPLASFAQVPADTVVTAYQTANGLVNLVTPTSAVVMGGLAIARVPYGTWIRFVAPLLGILAVISILVLWVPVVLKPWGRARGAGDVVRPPRGVMRTGVTDGDTSAILRPVTRRGSGRRRRAAPGHGDWRRRHG